MEFTIGKRIWAEKRFVKYTGLILNEVPIFYLLCHPEWSAAKHAKSKDLLVVFINLNQEILRLQPFEKLERLPFRMTSNSSNFVTFILKI